MFATIFVISPVFVVSNKATSSASRLAAVAAIAAASAAATVAFTVAATIAAATVSSAPSATFPSRLVATDFPACSAICATANAAVFNTDVTFAASAATFAASAAFVCSPRYDDFILLHDRFVLLARFDDRLARLCRRGIFFTSVAYIFVEDA